MSHERAAVRIPDVEVVISAAGSDVGIVAFYFPRDPHQVVEVVTSVEDAASVSHLVALLHQAIASLNGEDWFTLAELDVSNVQKQSEPPF